VSPTLTTTYYLTETITATGCKASDSVIITINAIPAAPNASANGPLCIGETLLLKADSITGASYSWSGPNSFSSTLRNPSRSNVVKADSGLYSVSVAVGGCSSNNSGSVNVVVNDLPVAIAGTSTAICTGASASIGGSSVTGNSYSWTSNPSGFTSAVSNPSV